MAQDSILLGRSVRLRPLNLSDAEPLHEVYSESQTMRFYGKPVCNSLDESRHLVAQILELQTNENGFHWAILQPQDAIAVGSIGFHGWERKRNCAFLSYEIVPRHRGKRWSVEAGRLAIEFGTSSMGLQRILAVIDPQNFASVATAECLGFTRELDSHDSTASNKLKRCTYSLSIDG